MRRSCVRIRLKEKTPTGKQKARWTQAFWKHADPIELPSESSCKALAIYRADIAANSELVSVVKEAVNGAAEKPRWKPYVDALATPKSIEVQSAFMAAAEFGDLTRFKSGRKASCWLGIVLKNDSSGE